MQRYYLILKGNSKVLAIEEFKTLWELYNQENIYIEEVENTLYTFFSKKEVLDFSYLDRLTYTNYLAKQLSRAKKFEDLIFEESEIKIYEGKSFLIRIKRGKHGININYTEKDLARPIWNMFENPKVSLFNPDIEFNFIFTSKSEEIIFCKKIFENDKDYLRRMPKQRPIKKPYTLKSDMARASINLLKLKKGIFLDPFCGIGGILLEAKDMGFEVLGNDISWNDLNYTKENFKYFFPNENINLILADSSNRFLKDNSIDGIVSDIPYGKSSRLKGEDLYEKFLKSAQLYLKKGSRIVLIYANFVDFKDKALNYFNEVMEIEEYINRSLTRYILVLENTKK